MSPAFLPLSLLAGLGLGLALAALGGLLLGSRVVGVAGRSMEPTLRDGDRVLVSADLLTVRGLRRGQVVAARVPDLADALVIKRVVGLAGDPDPVAGLPLDSDDVWLGADNRDRRALGVVDSARWGPLPADRIVGLVWCRVWPLGAAGLLRRRATA